MIRIGVKSIRRIFGVAARSVKPRVGLRWFTSTAPPEEKGPAPGGFAQRQNELFEDILDITPKEMSHGFLVICPTPIGNLNDMSIRQYEVLLNVDIIACEDTRVVGKLFKLLRERQVGRKMSTLFAQELTEVQPTADLVEEDDEDDSPIFDRAFSKKDKPLTVTQTKEKAKRLLRKGDSLSFFSGFRNDEDQESFVYGLDDSFIRFLRQRIAETREKKGRGILVSHYQHNEELRIPRLIQAMRYGLKVALVCDAGTPTISDPGYKLVNAALKEGLLVEALPGPSAVIVALSACGFPADKFIFEGYLSKTTGLREERLEHAKQAKATCILFENPQRLLRTLLTIEKVFGETQMVYVGLELSKLHERHVRGRVREVYERLNSPDHKDDFNSLRGEATLVIAPYSTDFNVGLLEERAAAAKALENADTNESLPETVPANVERLMTVLGERLEANDQDLTELLSEGLGLPRSKVRTKIVELRHAAERKLRRRFGQD
eukprot:TRINITY_DN6569_c0_g1_i2.p1 TRINITY_DN6569_c0_g1~~TRINITY_DN6569_c0_g1_i2.p1  ORF type:complete len:492 (-),score=136.03 TRINITY_DN6569_c0_g1_i2:87-1562(-)